MKKINWSMQTTKYIWQNGEFIEWEKAIVHVLCHAFHYGSGVFEGIRFYETKKGPAIFRLNEHTKRLFYSANVLKMNIPFSQEEINQATVEIVRKNKVSSGYIRPIIFFGAGKMGLNPVGAPVETAIACWPWGKYLGSGAIKVKTSPYIRIHPKSTICDAKISGHYINSILSSYDAQEAGCDESLLLDFEGNIAEGPGENFFMVKNNKLITPPLGKILKGITRDSVIILAKDMDIEVLEKNISLEEAYKADELFFTGTAAEVGAIGELDGNLINNGNEGKITKKLREKFFEIVEGNDSNYQSWLTLV